MTENVLILRCAPTLAPVTQVQCCPLSRIVAATISGRPLWVLMNDVAVTATASGPSLQSDSRHAMTLSAPGSSALLGRSAVNPS
jgi:hypothetical protein